MMKMFFQEDAPQPDEQLRIEGISSPIAAHILDFCDDGLGDNLLAAVTSTSGPFAASSEDVSSSSTATPPLCSYSDDIPEMPFSPLPCFDSTLSALLEEEQNACPETELIPPINETLAAPGYYQAAAGEASIEQFGQSRLPQSSDPLLAMQMSSTAPISMPLAPGCDEECLTAALARGYMSLDGALYPQTGAMIPSYNTEASKVGFFNGNSANSNGMVVLDMSDIGEYQRMMEGEGLTRTYSDTDSMKGTYSNTAEMQNGGNNQDLINGCNGSPPTLPPTETSGLEDSTFKVVRLSAEQRKEKIHRYIKKRNERNFSKKIKYACRKTLADSRPRVRGRFAKNDELCEATRSSSQNHEQYGQIAGADGENMLDSSDILAHLSGINNYSYKYNCTIESWI
ncbi:zinc finger protein CONSTANS-LIKE 4-like isoform X2 [Triticum dicoccoides]|uniref:zinc finger protein CONSTANS-LIKE 4-like isoform X2 n=1 Tax=Triticum dicoccoides TaxID=85692 RepID=UPI000E7A0FD0|nr:zinc finger protein CONSTANS-LIKE 4-like isoform X2 [Triticum dicoccoides]